MLNHVNLTVIENAKCTEVYNGVVRFSNICTVGPYNTNVCSGDSGGPLVTIGIEGELILVGDIMQFYILVRLILFFRKC